jgi:hypothetical protein
MKARRAEQPLMAQSKGQVRKATHPQARHCQKILQ